MANRWGLPSRQFAAVGPAFTASGRHSRFRRCDDICFGYVPLSSPLTSFPFGGETPCRMRSSIVTAIGLPASIC
jgi:hypothetical protein